MWEFEIQNKHTGELDLLIGCFYEDLMKKHGYNIDDWTLIHAYPEEVFDEMYQ